MKVLSPILLSAALLLLPLSRAHSQDADLDVLRESAVRLIDSYNEGEAETIASLFTPAGELVLSSGELVLGREALQAHYEEVFSEEDRPAAALEVESVRFLSPTLVIGDGAVHLTYLSGEVSSHLCTVVYEKQEEEWLIASFRDLEGDEALPGEKLQALGWLIGDWVIQTDDANTWISFSFSDDGPYIDARALTESPDSPGTMATFRIGWNEKEESFQSWAFDANGGYTQSAWAADGVNRWLLKTSGITAAGETNNLTQVMELDPDGQSFVWSKKDQVIGGEVQSDQSLEVVKRPPQPLSAKTPAE